MNKLNPRTWTYIFAGMGLLALVLLAISLNALKLAPGQPVSFQQLAPQVSTAGGANDWSRYLMTAFRLFMILFWILVPILLLLMILDKEGRKRLLRYVAIILPFLLLLFYVSSQKPAQNVARALPGQGLAMATPDLSQLSKAPPPPAYTPPPAWVTTLATVGISVSVAAIVLGGVFTIWRRWKIQQELQLPIKQVQREAQAALDALYAGGDLRETILRCYVQMTEAVQEYRGISRNRDMTPHEFEQTLVKRGLPGEPVRQLTLLFEQVRYGAVQPGRQDERTAISSLSAIVSASQRTHNG